MAFSRWIVILVGFLIAGCSVLPVKDNVVDVDSSPPASDEEMLVEMYKRGIMPRMNISGGVVGVDENQNGIRDDLDAFIERHKKPGDAGHRAIVRLSRAKQRVTTEYPWSEEIVTSIYGQMGNGAKCILEEGAEVYLLNKWISWVDAIELFMRNTPGRAEIQDEFMREAARLRIEVSYGEEC